MCPKEHAFCSACIRLHLAQKQAECPECQTPIRPEDLNPAPRILRNMLADMRMSCAFKKQGCTHVTRLEQLAAHEKTCTFGEQPCKYCRRTFPGKLLEAHEDKCEDKSVMCSKDCGLKVHPNRVRAPATPRTTHSHCSSPSTTASRR